MPLIRVRKSKRAKAYRRHKPHFRERRAKMKAALEREYGKKHGDEVFGALLGKERRAARGT